MSQREEFFGLLRLRRAVARAEKAKREVIGSSEKLLDNLVDMEKHRLQRCPYQQDLKIFCGEANCSKTDCPIFLKESGLLAQALSERD